MILKPPSTLGAFGFRGLRFYKIGRVVSALTPAQNFHPQYPFKELFLFSKNNKLTLFKNEQYLHLVG